MIIISKKKNERKEHNKKNKDGVKSSIIKS